VDIIILTSIWKKKPDTGMNDADICVDITFYQYSYGKGYCKLEQPKQDSVCVASCTVWSGRNHQLNSNGLLAIIKNNSRVFERGEERPTTGTDR
jgi:hypothetical protein